MSKKQVLIILILFSVISLFLFPEVFVLRNGDVIRGKLIKMDEDTMTIITKKGEFVIDRDDIDQIYKDEKTYKNKKLTIISQKKEISIKKNMVLIKGGVFLMGSKYITTNESGTESPVHEVEVGDFLMNKYEVTVGDFKVFIEETGYKTIAEILKDSKNNKGKKDKRYWKNPGFEQSDDYPVTFITWYDAIEFCNWISKKEGLTQCYVINKKEKDKNNKNPDDKIKWTVICDFNANGYRLPTETEWEYTARKGYNTKMNKDDYMWYGENSGLRTHPVGQKLPNKLGIYDIFGNVWEWCWDWYSKYKKDFQKDPQGNIKGKNRILRGASFISQAIPGYKQEDRVVTVRLDDRQDNPGKDKGFRVVRSAK